MLKGFRDFLLRGNVVDLAVAVIIGTAFNGIVTSLVKDVFTPLIGAIFGQPDFSSIQWGPILIGNFLNNLISFVIIAAVVYFLIVVPMNAVMERMRKKSDADAPPAPTREEILLAEIRDLLKAQQS